MTTTSDAAGPRGPVFLSYARADGREAAGVLREALAADGIPVWGDVERIAGGAWAESIERALADAPAMLALLTPCAVGRHGPGCQRESDSVCLDEIHYARFGPRPVPVVPVMVRACQPPLLLYRLHCHDFTRIDPRSPDFVLALGALEKDLARAASGKPRYRSFVDRLAPLDFEAFLRSKRRGFVRREWLFERVETFVHQSPARTLLIEGLAGVGKSSFLAELIRRNPGGMVMAYHCCQADAAVTLSAAELVCTVASMIASQHPAYAAELDNPAVGDRLARDRVQLDPASAFEQGVLAPLNRLPPPDDRVHVLAIDALDEALLRRAPDRGDPDPLTIVDLLSTRLDRFPKWLKLLATARPHPPVKDRFAHGTVVIAADDPLNREDLAHFIRSRLAEGPLQQRLRGAGRSEDDVAKQLGELAAGNFLYASQVLDELAGRLYDVAELDVLPAGLEDKYRWFFKRQFPTKRSFAPARRVLELLVAAQAALPHGDLARAIGGSLDEQPAMLAPLASFVRTDPGSEPAYSVHHKSMTAWLTAPLRSQELHFVHPADGHTRLADSMWRVFQEGGAAALSRYAVTHLPAHLAACADGAADETERSQRLEQLVTFVLHAGVQGHHLQTPALVHDSLRLALERAARGTPLRCVRLVFEAAWGLLTFRRARLRPERMFALAENGDLDGFAAELAVHPASPSFRDLALLLGAWLANDRAPGAAKAFRQRLALSPQTHPRLIARVDAALAGAPPPLPPPTAVVREDEIRAVLIEASGADLDATSDSLYALVPSIVGHPDPVWVRDVLLEIAKAALAGGELEFAEPAVLALAARASRAPGRGDFARRVAEIEEEARLSGRREGGDWWEEHRRRLGAAAEATAKVMKSDPAPLFERARQLPRGSSGMEAYARQTQAESLLVCGQPREAIEAELDAADAAALNVRDASFRALTTARIGTLRRRWWPVALDPGALDVEGVVRRLERADSPRLWAVEHETGGSPPTARSLGEIPDPGFRPLLAAFLSAVALVAPELDDRRRVQIIQLLVPAAIPKPTALHTVLGRLALAAVRAGVVDAAALGLEATEYARRVHEWRRPAGRALLSERHNLAG